MMETVEWGERYVSRRSAGGRQYGIRLHLSNGRTVSVDDVDSSPIGAQRLIDRLRGEEVDSIQLYYLIEDYLASRYSLK